MPMIDMYALELLAGSSADSISLIAMHRRPHSSHAALQSCACLGKRTQHHSVYRLKSAVVRMRTRR